MRIDDIVKGMADLLFPFRCFLCHSIIEKSGLCTACDNKLHFIVPPYCECCGFPLFVDNLSDGILCGVCLQKIYKFSKMRSVFVYDEDVRKLIVDFKFRNLTLMEKFLGSCMIYAGCDLMMDVDVVVPVPLHRFRLFKRKYNQAALLAKVVAKFYHVSFKPRALVRVRNTKSQYRLTKLQRVDNVRNAFKVRNTNLLDDKVILLVDDLFTTGATVGSCVKELIKAGANEVRVLTLARRV